MLPSYATASTSIQYYKTISHILSYSSLAKNSTVCVLNDEAVTLGLKQYFQQISVNYQVKGVTDGSFMQTNCQAVYFPHQSPKVENDWINRYPRALLSMSGSNVQCELGSAFCLLERQQRVVVEVNLDALSRSKVRIDPRLLQMWTARNK